MDNGLGRSAWSPAKQARILQELGYDGMSLKFSTADVLQETLRELDARKLRLFALFLIIRPGDPAPLPPRLVQAFNTLKGRIETTIWVVLAKPKLRPASYPQTIATLKSAADLAALAGLRLVVYPHRDCLAASAEETVELIRNTGNLEIGVSLNLDHEIFAQNGNRLATVAAQVSSHLTLTTFPLCPPDADTVSRTDFQKMTDHTAIRRLVNQLMSLGYAGPVGMQFFGSCGDTKTVLRTALRNWRRITR